MSATLDRWLKDQNQNLPSPKPREVIDVDNVLSKKRARISLSNAGTVWQEFAEQQRASQAAKRARMAPKKKARLDKLPLLPLDILYEIFSHLEPLDVLHLTRTTKDLRSVLLSRSASSVWQSARAHIQGIPDCPDDLSEPAYAALAFDARCHGCQAKNIPLSCVWWELRTRLCHKCEKEMLWSDHDHDMDVDFESCMPLARRDDEQWAFRSVEVEFVEKLNQLGEAREAFEKAHGRYPEGEEDEMNVWACALGEKKDAIEPHAALCQAWAEKATVDRAEEIERLRKERRETIESHLRELGYGYELDNMPRYQTALTKGMCLFKDHPIVKLAKPLTPRAWLSSVDRVTSMMDQWRTFLQARRVRMVQNTRRGAACEVLRMYKKDHPSTDPGELQPTPADFCFSLPAVRALVDRPVEDKVLRADFAALVPQLPKMLATWRRERICALAEHTFGERIEYASASERLQLATTVFHCAEVVTVHLPPDARDVDIDEQSEHSLFWWPHALHHGCCRTKIVNMCALEEASGDPARKLGAGFLTCTLRAPLEWKSLQFSDIASAIAERVVRACGRDPATATAAEMDKLDARLVCLKCSYGAQPDGERVMCVRGWRSSIQHCLARHFGDKRVRWARVSDTDAARAPALEVAERAYLKSLGKKQPKEVVWKCALCADTSLEPERMRRRDAVKHILIMHSSNTAVEDVDYFRSPDAAPRLPLTIKMTPRLGQVAVTDEEATVAFT